MGTRSPSRSLSTDRRSTQAHRTVLSGQAVRRFGRRGHGLIGLAGARIIRRPSHPTRGRDSDEGSQGRLLTQCSVAEDPLGHDRPAPYREAMDTGAAALTPTE
jgi:hypothetical protein